jgi:hypothetical protein
MDSESDGKVGGKLLDDLFSAFEDLETQSAGILQFLKAKGLATDEELAPYLLRAADASNVRWLAARLRMDALLAAAIKDAEEEFARTMEERAAAHDLSAEQKTREQAEPRQKPVKDKHKEAKADASNEDFSKKPQAANPPETKDVSDVSKDKTQDAVAKPREAKPDTEVPAAKDESAVSEDDRDDNADDTNQKAA